MPQIRIDRRKIDRAFTLFIAVMAAYNLLPFISILYSWGIFDDSLVHVFSWVSGFNIESGNYIGDLVVIVGLSLPAAFQIFVKQISSIEKNKEAPVMVRPLAKIAKYAILFSFVNSLLCLFFFAHGSIAIEEIPDQQRTINLVTNNARFLIALTAVYFLAEFGIVIIPERSDTPPSPRNGV